jgi:hypothetical protein
LLLPASTADDYPSASTLKPKPLALAAPGRNSPPGRFELPLRSCEHGELRHEEDGQAEKERRRAERPQQYADDNGRAGRDNDHAPECVEAHAGRVEQHPDG